MPDIEPKHYIRKLHGQWALTIFFGSYIGIKTFRFRSFDDLVRASREDYEIQQSLR